MKLILVRLTCAVVVVMSSASSFAIPINETEFFRQSVPNLTSIQKGTLFLCEGQNVTFGMGSCSDRNATTSDAVVFNQIGPNTLSVIMQSDFDPGERNPPPADLLELPIPFLLPFVSVSEPAGNEEHGNQTYIYTPDVGQPGYAFSNNNRVTWEITSDAPEPSTFLLLCSGLLAAIPVAKRSRIKK